MLSTIDICLSNTGETIGTHMKMLFVKDVCIKRVMLLDKQSDHLQSIKQSIKLIFSKFAHEADCICKEMYGRKRAMESVIYLLC